MARLFISHSSRNNDKAVAVRDWLAANGWNDVFLDLDPERGIVAGQRWKEALQQAAHRCEVVLALVSAEWLASSYCKAEINTAQMMGKKTIIALIDKSQVPSDLTDEQFIDLSGDPQAYRRLKKGLELAGLDPLSFPFEPGRRPYPGFAYFEEQDAAVFFGRDAQILRGLDELRRLVRTGISRMLVILGASGSGKSSFLRAGLWPRLKRDDRAWLPLPIVRPERAVISGTYGLAGALQQIVSEARFTPGFRQRGLPRSRADIEDFIKTEDGLVRLFDALRDIGQVPGLSGEIASPPTIVFALDQGEELFNEEGRAEAERFVEILTRTLRADPRALVILAMRSDSFPLVQAHPGLAALAKDTFTLDMMLEGSYRAVIEDPARLIEPTPLRIDPQLTEALLKEISGQDALPLLAFTLAHLYETYRTDKELTLAGYDKLGHVSGVIDTAVKQAFSAGVAKGQLPNDAKAQLTLARVAFIPHLAQVNPAGHFVRRVATRDQIPAEARPLVDSFAEQRLLTKDRRKDADGKEVDVVEVAHETLLRQPPFSEWLEEDREFLIGKQQLQNDLHDWAEAKPSDKTGALLTGLKLSRMRAWLAARPQDLTPQERDFGKASIEQADAEERRKARQRRIITRASVAAAVVLGCFAVVAGWQWREAIAQKKTAETAQNDFLVQALAGQAQHQPEQDERGALLARQAYLFNVRSRNPTSNQANVDDAFRSVLGFRYFSRILRGHTDRVWSIALSPDSHTMASGSLDGTIRVWDLLQPGTKPIVLRGHENWVTSVAFSADGQMLASSGDDKTVRLWDLRQPGAKPRIFNHNDRIWTVAFSPDGHTIASRGEDTTISLWDLRQPNAKPTILSDHKDLVKSLVFSSDGRMLASGSADKTVRLWNLSQPGAAPIVLAGHEESVTSVALSPDGRVLASGSQDNTIRLWNLLQPNTPPTLIKQNHPARSVSFSPDGHMLASGSEDKTVRLWDLRQLSDKPTILTGPLEAVNSVAFSSDGLTLASGNDDKTVSLWELAPPSGAPTVLRQMDAVTSLAFSPDANLLASGSQSDHWKAHDATLWNLDYPDTKPIILTIPNSAGIYSVAFRRDGQMLATSAESTDEGIGGVQLWNLNQPGTKPTVLSEARGYSLAFSPDGDILASAGYKQIQIWNLRQLEDKPLILEGHENYVTSVAFSPDGHSLAAGSKDNTVRVWNLSEPNAGPIILRGHDQAITSVAFGSDGHTIASGSEDKTVRLWNLHQPDADPVVLSGHEDKVRSVAFSPDGQTLASSSNDQTVRLWALRHPDVVPIILRAVLASPVDGLSSVAFSSNGQSLATGSDDGTIWVWNVRTETLADLVCKKVWRNLTLGEWRRFVGQGIPYERTCPNLPADSESTFNPEPPAAAAREIVAPVQISPTDKSIFNHYPRTVTLRWSDVPGAKSYSVETSFLSGTSWSAAAQASNLRSTSYTYDFVGNQTGRWRVWAVDTAGRESPMSCWWEFTFTR
jgi:WD40 repeat protein